MHPVKKSASSATRELISVPNRAAAESRNDHSYIFVFDSYGREMSITNTGSLPGAIKSSWNDPDQLYGLLLIALQDGFLVDILDAAVHLYRTDHVPSRGAAVYGVFLVKSGRLDEAERVFHSYLRAHGHAATILTNLAKVQLARNQVLESERTVWEALEIDPNTEIAFGRRRAIQRELGGEFAETCELERIAALPGSWRAQMWLARAALSSHDFEKAFLLYRQGLNHAEWPVPVDLLMQMTGDLEDCGQLAELLKLAEPEFVPQRHGLLVGNNLIKAHLDLAQIDAASRILEQLCELHRPDWKEQLNLWDTAIAKAR